MPYTPVECTGEEDLLVGHRQPVDAADLLGEPGEELLAGQALRGVAGCRGRVEPQLYHPVAGVLVTTGDVANRIARSIRRSGTVHTHARQVAKAIITVVTLPFHNGRTEGVNTRTKMIKRQSTAAAASPSCANASWSPKHNRDHQKCHRAEDT
jgi:hypothetical protein